MLPFYNLFIAFLIIAFLHKSISLIVLFNIPIDKVRLFFNIIELLFLTFFLFYYKLNIRLKIIIALLFIAPIRYWLVRRGLIYNFVDNNEYNNRIINFMRDDAVFAIVGLDWLFLLFAISYVFMPSSYA